MRGAVIASHIHDADRLVIVEAGRVALCLPGCHPSGGGCLMHLGRGDSFGDFSLIGDRR